MTCSTFSRLKISLDQLRIFVAVVEHLNMTSAARALGLTQSAVSAAVATIERRFATRLFDRNGRQLVLSRVGTAFWPEAESVLRRASEAEDRLKHAIATDSDALLPGGRGSAPMAPPPRSSHRINQTRRDEQVAAPDADRGPGRDEQPDDA